MDKTLNEIILEWIGEDPLILISASEDSFPQLANLVKQVKDNLGLIHWDIVRDAQVFKF